MLTSGEILLKRMRRLTHILRSCGLGFLHGQAQVRVSIAIENGATSLTGTVLFDCFGWRVLHQIRDCF